MLACLGDERIGHLGSGLTFSELRVTIRSGFGHAERTSAMAHGVTAEIAETEAEADESSYQWPKPIRGYSGFPDYNDEDGWPAFVSEDAQALVSMLDYESLCTMIRKIVREEVKTGLHDYVLATIADIGANASQDVAAQVEMLRCYGVIPRK